MNKHSKSFGQSKKKYSQKIAVIFKIFSLFMLIPAAIGIFFSLFLLPYGLIIIFVVTLGLILFAGYISHSKGNLNKNEVISLWVGTIIYNGVPVIFSFVKIMPYLIKTQTTRPESSRYITYIICLNLGWIAAFSLAMFALKSDLKEY